LQSKTAKGIAFTLENEEKNGPATLCKQLSQAFISFLKAMWFDALIEQLNLECSSDPHIARACTTPALTSELYQAQGSQSKRPRSLQQPW
jgi:hypothetical protein